MCKKINTIFLHINVISLNSCCSSFIPEKNVFISLLLVHLYMTSLITFTARKQRQPVRCSETQSYLITVNTAQLLFKGTSANQEAEGESDVTVGVAFVSVHACMQTAAFSTGNRPVYLQSVSPARVHRPLVAELVSAALKHDNEAQSRTNRRVSTVFATCPLFTGSLPPPWM